MKKSIQTRQSPDDLSVPSPQLLNAVDCWISFGGNLGDVRANFDAALALLSLHPQIVLGKRSGIYSTAPIGSQAGSAFLNSVCGLETDLSCRQLLKVLQSIENQLGRTRDLRWGPRTIDLDVLSYGQQVINQPDLIVPHPGLAYRRFVLDPMAEVAPGWNHPLISLSAYQLSATLVRRPLNVLLVGLSSEQVDQLSGLFASRFPEIRLLNENCSGEYAIRICTRLLNPCQPVDVDLSHSPGDCFEKLTSTFTAMLDQPSRVSDW